jgi:tRNA (guanine37-N1)-methyltransferase
MRIDVVTIFPEMIEHAAQFGVTGRALQRGLWRLGVWNPRDFVSDRHRTVDDRPYGGGPGMVMMAEPLAAAMAAARAAHANDGLPATRTLCLSPAGKPLTHDRVAELAAEGDTTALLLLAGRYEGIDERLFERERVEEVAIGEFVVSGGELPALMLIDAVLRLRPGVLNDADSAAQDSFADGLLDCPHYTRPEVYDGARVPDVLLSGHHEAIRGWRLQQALGRTWERRPDLLERRALSDEERKLLAAYQAERGNERERDRVAGNERERDRVALGSARAVGGEASG